MFTALKTKNAAHNKRTAREAELRKELWPEVTDGEIWHRKRQQGFTTVPRTLPMVMVLMDEMAGKGKPVSRTYLTLWGRVRDEAIVRLQDERLAALESGFGGPRRTTAWRDRMRILQELGFIKTKPGGSGEFTHVLILNPHLVIKRHWESRSKGTAPRMSEENYLALKERADDVGASDVFEDDNQQST